MSGVGQFYFGASLVEVGQDSTGVDKLEETRRRVCSNLRGALQAARQGHSNCKASHIYGTSGVVGDKNACIMGGYTLPGSYGVGAVGGMAAGAR
jgi:hypothetical protein